MARDYSGVAFTQAATGKTHEMRIDAEAFMALIEQHGDQLKTFGFNVDDPDDPINEEIIPVLVHVTQTCIDQEILAPGEDPQAFFNAVVNLVDYYRQGKTLQDFAVKH